MKRLRHFLAATTLLLGLVYFYVKHESLSVGAPMLHAGSPTNVQQAHGFSDVDSDDQAGKATLAESAQNRPVLDQSTQTSSTPAISSLQSQSNKHGISSPVAESTSTMHPSSIGFDFQKDLNLELPVDTFARLSENSPHNRNLEGAQPYAYATFFASRNPSTEDPYYLAIHSLIYRILWAPRSRTSQYPIIVFVGDFVSTEQRRLLAGAGAIVKELATLPWHPEDPGVQERWKDLFAKLHMWNETSYNRILFLDADALPIAPIDEMFELKKVRNCIESKMQLDDFLPGGEPICEPYIFAGVPHDPYSIFDVDINVGSMVFTPNARQHQRLVQNYLKFDKYDVKMAEQAFLNWQFGINSAYPPGMLEREYGAFFPNADGEKGIKIVHEKIWAVQSGHWKDEWDGTWKEMLDFYRSEAFIAAREEDGHSVR
ncbi:hypothetical protein OPT61_g1681 [Boeremia exigua]|uniref:Uncharacterized protein n=1 Tax=Boeremia exigua TaxID=749465 RepID=A0ACC2IPL9_9PLEO|nr:hypothetical protein OPT61_g1681 [Boeremia exigua]